MRKSLLALLLGFGLAGPANAALPVGAKAPQLVTEGALAGKSFRFNLAAALKKGPVVLYFYPKAFTKGCTIEANAFAEASPQYEAMKATHFGHPATCDSRIVRMSSGTTPSR